MKFLNLLLTVAFFTLPLAAHAKASARIVTDLGTIKISIDAEGHPQTADNFAKLVTGEGSSIDIKGKKVNKPFYNGLTFHRANPELGIFTGCPWGSGRGWPGYFMPDEKPEESKFDQPGVVAMAKIQGNKQYGSQFFITTAPQPGLNGKYTAFGNVISGMEIVKAIASVPRGPRDNPLKPIRIKTIEMIYE